MFEFAQKYKTIIMALILASMLGTTFYYGCKHNAALKEKGVYTIGITYEELSGRNVSIRYFFKTTRGIYVGLAPAGYGQTPGYYYSVKYSSDDPSISEMSYDTLFPDSVGRQFIRMEEINHSNVVNGADWSK